MPSTHHSKRPKQYKKSDDKAATTVSHVNLTITLGLKMPCLVTNSANFGYNDTSILNMSITIDEK